MKISKKLIIDIEVFMANYLGVIYDGEYKLTHGEMNLFLFSKNISCPKRCTFQGIKMDDIISGKYLIVKDEANKVIPYFNPVRSKTLVNEMCRDQEILSIRRENTLSRDDYGKDVGRADYIKYISDKNKRPKPKARVLKKKELEN